MIAALVVSGLSRLSGSIIEMRASLRLDIGTPDFIVGKGYYFGLQMFGGLRRIIFQNEFYLRAITAADVPNNFFK
jgi:hypothetical protein